MMRLKLNFFVSVLTVNWTGPHMLRTSSKKVLMRKHIPKSGETVFDQETLMALSTDRDFNILYNDRLQWRIQSKMNLLFIF